MFVRNFTEKMQKIYLNAMQKNYLKIPTVPKKENSLGLTSNDHVYVKDKIRFS